MRFPEQLLLDSADIAAVAPPLAEIVDMVEETYRMDGRGEVEVPLKAGVHPDHPHSFLHAMPAWVAGERALGMKWISYYPGNTERGYPDSSGLIVLNDPEHGLPVAIMEGMWDHLRADGGLRRGGRQALRAPGPRASRAGRMRRPGAVVPQGAVGAVPHPEGCLRRIAQPGEPREILRRHGGGGELDPDPGGHRRGCGARHGHRRLVDTARIGTTAQGRLVDTRHAGHTSRCPDRLGRTRRSISSTSWSPTTTPG